MRRFFEKSRRRIRVPHPIPRKSALENGPFLNRKVVCAVSALERAFNVNGGARGGFSSPPPGPGPGGAERASEKTSERPHVFRVGLFLRSLKDLKDPTSALPFLYVARGCPDRTHVVLSSVFSFPYPVVSDQYSVPSTQYPVLSTQRSTHYSVQNSVLSTQYSVLNTEY